MNFLKFSQKSWKMQRVYTLCTFRILVKIEISCFSIDSNVKLDADYEYGNYFYVQSAVWEEFEKNYVCCVSK